MADEQLDRLQTALADRYAVQRELGRGGMAAVYLAEDIRHERHVALKVLKPVLAGQKPTYELSQYLTLHGDVDEWMDRIRISVNMEGLEPDPTLQRRVRDRSYAAMERFFDEARRETSWGFDEWYQRERRGQAECIFQLFRERLVLLRRVSSGLAPFTEDVWNPRFEAEIVPGLMHVVEEVLGSRDDTLDVVLRFLFSDVAYDAPANDISALLMAAVARKAASGQRRPPSPGMWNDMTAIASFLPYCDAMFLDNECAGLLREEPLRTKLAPFGTRIFSSRTGHEFLAYLRGLEEQAGPEHVRLVADVYGDDWSVPYRDLLVHERERQERTARR